MSDPTDTRGPRAVLFDIDGTLVDSNYLHLEAWAHAFADLDVAVDVWRVHRLIGMDSGAMLDEVLGERSAQLADRAKELHSRYYEALAGRLRPFADARALIAELSGRGATVVFATSAPPEELETLRGVLDVDQHVAHETSSGDVETAKPQPDLIETALQRSGAAASDAIMVGDAVWDVVAAARAGVDCIGVLSGGYSSEAELREAGAIAVYDDVAALLAGIDESPLAGLLD